MIEVIVPAITSDLTTLARLKTELGISTTTDDALMALHIKEASGIVTRHCRRDTFGERFLRQTEYICGSVDYILLAEDLLPIIDNVTEDGTALTAADYKLDGSLFYRMRSSRPSCWSGGSTVVIEYAAGFDLMAEVPYDLERATLDVAKRIYASRPRDPAVRSEEVDGVGKVSYFDGRSSGSGFDALLGPTLWQYRKIA